MQSTIEIRTLAGVRLDVNDNTSIEMIMGGFSLLDLSTRSTSYSNSFKLPRTPINDKQFAYASQNTRNNKSVIEVYITCGMFQKKATLTVISFDTAYNVTISYSSFINSLKGIGINDIISDITNPIIQLPYFYYTAIEYLQNETNYSIFHSYVDENIDFKDLGVFINAKYLTDLICQKVGYTTAWNIGIDLSDIFVFARDWYYAMNNYVVSGRYVTDFRLEAKAETQTKATSVLLKDICMFAGLYFDIDERTKTISFNKIENIKSATPILIETLEFTNKEIYSGYNATNKITYTTGDGISGYFKSAEFIGDGVAGGTAVQLGANIPAKNSGKYDLTGFTDTCICYRTGSKTPIEYLVERDYYPSETHYLNLYSLDFFDLTSIFTFMSDIFTAPVFCSASGYIDNLTADLIMKNKVLTSIRLGGTFFVESMNYNLINKKAVLKLIKL